MEKSHWTESYSKNNNIWYSEKLPLYYVGGTLKMSNSSGGYHGILKQWWDSYFFDGKVLLVSESAKVKEEFQLLYPKWTIKTTDFQEKTADIYTDLCVKENPFEEKFDLIINQATLEHLYNPFQAMENLVGALNINGIIISHTHPPMMGYHQFPRDYFRFMKDWWFDLPKYIKGIQLEEYYMHENIEVFTLYRKII